MFRTSIIRMSTILLAVSIMLTEIFPVAAQDSTDETASGVSTMSISNSSDDTALFEVNNASSKQLNKQGELDQPLGNGIPDARDTKYHNFLPLIDSTGSQSNEEVNGAETNAYWRTLKYEGFEGIFPSSGWSVNDCNGTPGGIQYWDDTSYQANPGYWSAWTALGGSNGVSPWTSNYSNNACANMIYGPFSLQYAQSARMTFNLWYQTETNYDFIHYRVSCDGYYFTGWKVSGNSNGWQFRSLDLNVCRGDSTVWVQFLFTSDSSMIQKGPFIDNIYIQEYR